MSNPNPKPLARSLGEFFGHIVKAVRTNPSNRRLVSKTTQERTEGDLVLRRTVIDEVEIKRPDPNASD